MTAPLPPQDPSQQFGVPAQPKQNIWQSITPEQQSDAALTMRRMLVGTKQLAKQPGVVYALAQQNAGVPDVQTVDQFMQGMDLEKQVRLHMASGSKMILGDQQRMLLDRLGVDYSPVEFNQNDALATTAKQIEGQGGKVERNADGSLKLDRSGNIVVDQSVHVAGKDYTLPAQAVSASVNTSTGELSTTSQAPDLPGEKPYKAKGVGRLFQTLHNDILKPIKRDAIDPAFGGMTRAWHVVDYNVGSLLDLTSDSAVSDDMKRQGYDPHSFFSTIAYESSGNAHFDMRPLAKQYGDAKVNAAIDYLDNPEGYRKKIEDDPASFGTDASGKTVMTPEAAAKLKLLQDPEFETLLKQVNAKRATTGNAIVGDDLRIDPIKHSTTYNLTSAGIDLAASFMIDPTLIVGKTARIAKMSQVGIDTTADADGAVRALTSPASPLSPRGRLQARWNSAIQKAQGIRAAEDAGDTREVARLTAQFVGEHKELEPILADMVGLNRFDGYAEKAGEAVPTFTKGEAWTSLDDAAEWLRSKTGMTRLMNGRGAVQASYMPGAASGLGYKWLKGKTAGWMTARSFDRADAGYQKVITAAQADPALAEKLISEGMLIRFMPEADDAVLAHDGTVIAERSTEGLASQERAQQYALSPAGKGAAAYNTRLSGDPLDATKGAGYFSPTAVAARSRMAAQRFSTLLPRNTIISLDGADSADKIRKYAMTYLNRGDANTLAAAWHVGDEGTRKKIISGMLDQLAHASGLTKTKAGTDLMAEMKTRVEAYSSVGDEAVRDGQHLALWEGQVRNSWTLPSFRQLQMAASKIGLWENTFGRGLTSQQADMLMAQWKMNALMKPSTITRNQLEGWLRVALEGKAGDAVKAKAIAQMPNKSLWARGFGQDALDEYRRARGQVDGMRSLLADKGLSAEQRSDGYRQIREAQDTMARLEREPIVQHLKATEAGDLKTAKQIENGHLFAGQQLGRGTVGTAAAALLTPISRAYRALYTRELGTAQAEEIVNYGPDRLAQALHNYGQQVTESELGARHAAREATEHGQAGFGSSRLKFVLRRGFDRQSNLAEEKRVTDGWAHQSLEDVLGAERYVNALHMRVDAQPDVVRAILDHIEADRSGGFDHLDSLDRVVKELEASKKHTAFGTLHWDDPAQQARKAVDDNEVLLGKREWAQKMVNDFHYLLTGRNGQYQQELADFIREEGRAPDADWITNNLTGENRPEAALAPVVMGKPAGEGNIISRLLDVEGEAYQWCVERILQRTTTGPVFLAHYAEAKVALRPTVDRLVEQGISKDAAENLARDLAEKNALIRTENLVDDPGQKSQFDVIARNVIPFSRATQAMLRRWGSGLWQDPTRARKMMLAYEGAVHSGFVYKNEYGDPTFTYPASGVMQMALRELAKVPGFQNIAHFPVASTMTGGVLMAVPGADNPFRFSMGPMVSIPMREVFKHLFPASMRSSTDKFDEWINGPVGVGETWTQLVPTAVRKFYVAMNGDERNSALASSMQGAIANLAAAGLLPAPDASPADRQQFLNRLRAQVKSQLFLRAVFGLVAPAAPSSPTEGLAETKADYAFHIDGAQQLADEYKRILNETGGDTARANAVWTALHPDDVAYKPDGTLDHAKYGSTAYIERGSKSAATGTYLPATEAALNWMSVNEGFVKKYGSVSAYFMPEQAGKDPFSYQAYKTQIELGLRVRKTPQEFMDDIQLRHAESIYYPAVKELDGKIAAADALGDTQGAQNLRALKSQWEDEFKTSNPLLERKMQSYSDARAKAQQQVSNLREMLSKGEVPDGQGNLLRLLVANYDGFEKFAKANPGSTYQATQARDSARAAFNSWVETHVANSPLADLYSGVFRVLDTNFVNIAPKGA